MLGFKFLSKIIKTKVLVNACSACMYACIISFNNVLIICINDSYIQIFVDLERVKSQFRGLTLHVLYKVLYKQRFIKNSSEIFTITSDMKQNHHKCSRTQPKMYSIQTNILQTQFRHSLKDCDTISNSVNVRIASSLLTSNKFNKLVYCNQCRLSAIFNWQNRSNVKQYENKKILNIHSVLLVGPHHHFFFQIILVSFLLCSTPLLGILSPHPVFTDPPSKMQKSSFLPSETFKLCQDVNMATQL